MESLMTGTMAGVGSFRCQQCGYVLTLAGSDLLGNCPSCGSDDFVRASLFATTVGLASHGMDVGEAPDPQAHIAWLADARMRIEEPGDYIVFEDQGEMQLVALHSEWTRIGRSLAADVRFDDPTVSRRHALIERQPDSVRVLDDRSLNGVFVNGQRVESQILADEDEIIVGRYRLSFLKSATRAGIAAGSAMPLQTV
jgi:predicted  nucleic acid-binding Zn-ribbon protein